MLTPFLCSERVSGGREGESRLAGGPEGRRARERRRGEKYGNQYGRMGGWEDGGWEHGGNMVGTWYDTNDYLDLVSHIPHISHVMSRAFRIQDSGFRIQVHCSICQSTVVS